MKQTEWFKEVFDLKDVKQDTVYHQKEMYMNIQ